MAVLPYAVRIFETGFRYTRMGNPDRIAGKDFRCKIRLEKRFIAVYANPIAGILEFIAEAGLDPERVNGIILPGADAVFRECGQCNVVMDIKLLKDNGAEAEDLPEFYIK